jgi:hypothetical protein
MSTINTTNTTNTSNTSNTSNNQGFISDSHNNQKNELVENNITKPELFDDIFYEIYRENNNFVSKENLFQTLVTDLISYLKTCYNGTEIRVGYIIYSKLQLSSSKMNNILNLLVQKLEPNIRVQSIWNIESSYKGPMQTEKGLETIDFDKIRIKIIVKPNDKDLAIKKLAEINLNHMRKNTKKVSEYLAKI